MIRRTRRSSQLKFWRRRRGTSRRETFVKSMEDELRDGGTVLVADPAENENDEASCRAVLRTLHGAACQAAGPDPAFTYQAGGRGVRDDSSGASIEDPGGAVLSVILSLACRCPTACAARSLRAFGGARPRVGSSPNPRAQSWNRRADPGNKEAPHGPEA